MMELNFPKNYSVGDAVILRIVEEEYHIRMSNEYNILGCHGRAAKCIRRVLINRVVSMWVRILATTVVLVSLSNTLNYNCFSSPRSIKNGDI